MTFATEKSKLSSSKFAMVRLRPSRDITSTLVSVGGGLYELSYDYVIPRTTRNGNQLTRVTTTPTVDDTFYYDKNAKKLTIKLAAAPNTSTNIIIADYYVFLTDEQSRIAAENPVNSPTYPEEHVWEPRLKTTPTVKQSIKNLLTGKLSLSASNISIINVDNQYNSLFTSDDSWHKKEVLIWFGINSQDNLQKVFEGSVKGVKLGPKTVEVTLIDKLTVLTEPAYMGDTRKESLYLDETGSFPGVYPGHADRACRYVVGSSYLEYADGYDTALGLDMYANGTGVFSSGYYLDPATLVEATCLSNYPNNIVGVSPTYSTSSSYNNRVWGCARTDVIKTLNYGTITSATLLGGATSGAWVYYRVPARSTVADARRARLEVVSTGHNLEVGDSFRINNSLSVYRPAGAVTSSFGVLVTEITANGYNCAVFKNKPGDATPNPPPTNESWLPGPSIIWYADLNVSVVITQGNNIFFPLCDIQGSSGSYVNQYLPTVSTTSGGNDMVKVTFFDDFEGFQFNTIDWFTEIGWTGPLHPDTHKVYFRLQSNNHRKDAMRHADIVKTIADKGGIAITSSSVTQANTDLSTHAMFTIPKKGDNSYQNYFHYLEKILKSTLGYIRLNNNNDFDYAIYKLPSSTEERNKHLIIKDSFSVQVVYDDIIVELETSNPEAQSASQSIESASEQLVTNTTDLYLHGINEKASLETVVTDMSIRAQEIVDLRSKRRAVYSFSVASEDLDSQIGDDLKIVFENVLGVTTTIEGKIIGIEKSVDKVKLQVTDLEGL